MKVLIKCKGFIRGDGSDMETGTAIIVEDSRIVDFMKDEDSFQGEIIDLEHLYLMPGIVDCHVHLSGTIEHLPERFVLEDNRTQTVRSVSQAQTLLDWGITSVRDISVNGVALQRNFDDGYLMGPRVVPCGPGLSRTAGHGDAHLIHESLINEMHPWAILCDTKDEIRKGIRQLVKEGSQCIKVWESGGGFWEMDSDADTHYYVDDLRLIVEEAEMAGLPVAVHAENLSSVLDAVREGVTSIEHGEELDDECVQTMVEKGIYLVPTLRLIAEWNDNYDPTPSKGDEQCMIMSRDEITDLEIKTMYDSFNKAIKAGVKIVLGSDSYCNSITPFGLISLEEIHYLARWGMGNMDAITAATKVGAQLLKIDDITGTLEAGKEADIIAFSENPLEDIANICYEKLKFVMKGGRVIKNII